MSRYKFERIDIDAAEGKTVARVVKFGRDAFFVQFADDVFCYGEVFQSEYEEDEYGGHIDFSALMSTERELKLGILRDDFANKELERERLNRENLDRIQANSRKNRYDELRAEFGELPHPHIERLNQEIERLKGYERAASVLIGPRVNLSTGSEIFERELRRVVPPSELLVGGVVQKGENP